jgi:hypothetical protein
VEEVNMGKDVFRRGMVFGIIFLFIGAGVIPNISGNIEAVDKEINGKNIHIVNNDGPGVDEFAIVDPVGIWNFNIEIEDVAFDSSGYENHGGCHGTEWTNGPPGYGKALLFNASRNSYVGVPDDPSLDFDDLGENQGFMIDFWMNVNQFPSNDHVGLVCKLGSGIGYYVVLDTQNDIWFSIANEETAHSISSDTLITDDEWHHIVAVWSGDTLYLYIDDMSTPDVSKYVGNFTIGDTSKWLEIGNHWASDDKNPFDGCIDEVQISIIAEDDTPPEVCIIEKPRERYRYLDGERIGNERSIFGWTLVIGPRSGITIEVMAKDGQSGIDRVEFYIDGEYYGEDAEPNPTTIYYEYGWVETRFGKCTLEAIAWDKAGHSTSSGIIRDVLYFNIE